MKILKSENLGEVLRGDRIVNTLYNVNVSIGAHKLGEWYGQYHMVHMIWLNLYFEHVASIISDERTFKLLGSMWTDNERSKSRLIQRYVTPVNFPIHQKLINLPLNHSILLQLTPFNPKLNQFSPNSVEIYLKLTKFHPEAIKWSASSRWSTSLHMYATPGGLRTKSPLGRRIPLYHFA